MSVTRQAPPLVPSWLTHLAAVGWRVLVTVALGVALLAIALRLGTTVASLMVGDHRRSHPRSVRRSDASTRLVGLKAAGALTGALVLGVLAVLLIVIVALVPSLTDIGTSISDAVHTTRRTQSAASPFGDAIRRRPRPRRRAGTRDVDRWTSSRRSARSVATIATIAMLATFMTFFLLLDGDKAWHASTQRDDGVEPRAPHARRPGCWRDTSAGTCAARSRRPSSRRSRPSCCSCCSASPTRHRWRSSSSSAASCRTSGRSSRRCSSSSPPSARRERGSATFMFVALIGALPGDPLLRHAPRLRRAAATSTRRSS